MKLYRQICMWLKAKGTPFEPSQFAIDNLGREIAHWDAALGVRPTAADLAPFDPQLEDLAIAMRHIRNQKLAACDWMMFMDSPLLPETRARWATYRQALRDITQQPLFPRRVMWPDPPT